MRRIFPHSREGACYGITLTVTSPERSLSLPLPLWTTSLTSWSHVGHNKHIVGAFVTHMGGHRRALSDKQSSIAKPLRSLHQKFSGTSQVPCWPWLPSPKESPHLSVLDGRCEVLCCPPPLLFDLCDGAGAGSAGENKPRQRQTG